MSTHPTDSSVIRDLIGLVETKALRRGTFRLDNGDRYDGEFAAGKPNGFGALSAANGSTLSGAWKDGCFKDGTRTAWFLNTKDGCGFK